MGENLKSLTNSKTPSSESNTRNHKEVTVKKFIHVEQVEHAKHTDDLPVLHVLHGQSKPFWLSLLED